MRAKKEEINNFIARYQNRGPFFVMNVLTHEGDIVLAQHDDLIEACKAAYQLKDLQDHPEHKYHVIEVWCGSSEHRGAAEHISWTLGTVTFPDIVHHCE